MYSGEFDGAAAAFGGGFMPSQATAVPDHSSLSKKSPDLASFEGEAANEISSSAEFTATIDGVAVITVKIVGKVCDIQDKEPQFTLLMMAQGRLNAVDGLMNAWSSMKPVIDFNEITSHFFKRIYVHIYNTNLRFSGQYSFDAGKSIDRIVLNFLWRLDCLKITNGVDRNDIVKQLYLPMYKLMEVLEYLNENSLVYTVDEVHCKSAVNA